MSNVIVHVFFFSRQWMRIVCSLKISLWIRWFFFSLVKIDESVERLNRYSSNSVWILFKKYTLKLLTEIFAYLRFILSKRFFSFSHSMVVVWQDKAMFFPCFVCMLLFVFFSRLYVWKKKKREESRKIQRQQRTEHVNACDQYQCSRCISFNFDLVESYLLFICDLVSTQCNDFVSKVQHLSLSL